MEKSDWRLVIYDREKLFNFSLFSSLALFLLWGKNQRFSPHCIAKIGLGEAIEAARRMKEESSGNEGALWLGETPTWAEAINHFW